ncbi:site-specific integrase [Candidatus Bathyarchaeota archaeon]|nr:site-specific integrase [Candidatus Bathyarchaeota archaeon]
MKVEDFLNYVKETKSKNTWKEYRHGIEKFAEWFGKSPNEIMELRTQDWASTDLHQKKRFVREIEKFHKNLIEKEYTINSARTMCLGLMQLFRFYEMPVTIQTGSDVSKTVVSTKDYVTTSEQNREMFKMADDLRSKIIISLGKDLGWRIGDFVKIKKEQLPNLEQEPPILFELITEKEDVLAKSFISAETVELLKQYLPTTPKENPYLFPSNSEKFIDPDTINRTLKQLAEKSNIKIPQNKRLRFHAFRKRFLSTCANLSVDVNIAKILVGKDVESSMLAYLSEVEHRIAFIKVYDVLKLTEIPMRKTRESTTDLEKRVDDLERLIHGVVALGGRELLEKARGLADIEIMPYETREIEVEEQIKAVGERQLETKQKLSKEQLEEYKRIIAENNGNNHNE